MSDRGPGRGAAIEPFRAMEVLREANALVRQGRDICRLEIGEPGTPAPEPAREAAARAIADGRIGYTDALGVPALREGIARHYGRVYGLDLDPARVVVTTGSSLGFLLAFLAAFAPGDRVGLALPTYPCYRNILGALGFEPVLIEAGPAERYQPTAGHLAALDRPLDGLMVASPSNPSGTMLDRAALRSLVEATEASGTRLISDEIYHGIAYEAPAVSALELTDQAIVINSFSKYFSMTGWRLGWVIVPPGWTSALERLSQNFVISAPYVSQVAGIAALECGETLDGYVRNYAANREILLRELPKAGFTEFAPPDGAFYIYAQTGHLSEDSEALSRVLLHEAGVATTPGTDFDPLRGRHTLRFSFAGPTAEIEEAARRLIAWHGGCRSAPRRL